LEFAALALAATLMLQPASAQAFEGRIHATITQGNQSQALLYTVGTDYLQKLTAEDLQLFLPPADYQELEPLPF
jgi:hypothetical protein